MLTFLNWLIEMALRRASVMVVVVAALFVAGLLSAREIKLELFPDVDFPAITVVWVYPGAAPEDVVEGVTKPAENVASTLAGLKRMQSVSSEGLGILLLEFGYGTDMEKRAEELATRLRDAPIAAAAGQPDVTQINVQLIPVTELSLSGDLPIEELDRIAAEEVMPALTGVDGVLQVEVVGGATPQVDVVLDPERLREAGLSAQAVAGAVQGADVAVPTGSIVAGERTMPLRTFSEIQSLEQLQELVVGVRAAPEGEAGAPVLLKDVAQVSVGRSETAGASRTNGQPSVAISVTKSPEANTVRVANRVNDEIELLQKQLGDDVKLLTVFDQSTQIKNSISGMLREGGWGALFAIVVVFLFLLSIRSTLVTAVSIPLSVVVALFLMYWFGFTLNLFTLGGLTIAIGRVIDDSIVVLENIYRHVHQEGEKLKDAVRTAPKEVASAITSSTLTTVAVFLPLGLIGGLVSELFRPFGFTVTFALLASLVVALTVVPGLARWLVGKGVGKPGKDTWLQRVYTPALKWSLRHRLLTLGIAGALFAVSLLLMRSVPVSLLPTVQEDVFDVTVIAPAGSDMDTVLAEAEKAETVLKDTPGVELFQTVVGGQTQSIATLSAALAGRGFSSARIFVKAEEGRDFDAVAADVRGRLQGISTNSIISVSDVQTSTLSRLQITAWGDDPEVLDGAAQQIIEAAAPVEGVANLISDAASKRPELAIDVDANKALLAGLSVQEVASYVRSVLIGQEIGKVLIDETRSAPVVLSTAGGIENVESLSALPVGPEGVPLGSIAEVRSVEAAAQLTRVDGRPAVTVNGDITAEDTGSVAREVEGKINDLSLPPGVEVQVGGVLSQIEESFNSMYIGIGLAIVLVYIVMVIFFGSLLEPFAILFSLPLASIGAFFALFITHNTLGLPALIGLLMLVGIVVTNAIVLMDLVRHLVQQGMDPYDALVQGGRTRLRPILMTAVATMLALVPLAMGFHQGTIIAAELATVVIGGLFTSTLLTLVVVPVIYSLLLQARSSALALRFAPVEGAPRRKESRREAKSEGSARYRRLPRERKDKGEGK